MGHMEASAAAAGLASLVLVPLSACIIAINAQLRLSFRLCHGTFAVAVIAGDITCQLGPCQVEYTLAFDGFIIILDGC